MPARLIHLSKFLSFVLRHKPDSVGIQLDSEGWTDIDELIEKSNAAGKLLTREELLHIEQNSDKKRFTISADGRRIRAAQGHSVAVDLGLEPREPPPELYHGTAVRSVDAILIEGLTPRMRQQVHLSVDTETARRVGLRHGKPAIFEIDTLSMSLKQYRFYLADNGVWLTDRVPPEFLTLLPGDGESTTTQVHFKPFR
jgi:putative RNA 2'-phosphotransferase